MRIFAIVFVFALFTTNAKAEIFTYLNGTNITLGNSWNPLKPYSAGGLTTCFSSTKSAGAPTASEQFSEGFTENFQQFKQLTSYSTSVAGSSSYGLAKISAFASYDSIRESLSTNRAIIYVVTGTRTYSPSFITSAQLTPAGEEILKKDKGNGEEFYKACGESLVTSITKEAKISLAYIFTASSSEKKEALKVAISAAVNGVTAGGKFNAKIFEEAKKVDSSASVDLKVFQSGTLDNSATVRNIVGLEPGAIGEVREKLRTAISTMTWESSPIIFFNADKVSDHFSVPSLDWTHVSKAYSRIDNMQETSERYVQRYMQLKEVLTEADKTTIKLKPDAKAKIIAELSSIDSRLLDLVDTAKACLAGSNTNCNTPYVEISTRIISYIDMDLGRFNAWRGQGSGSYDRPPEQIRYRADFWPEFTIKNLNYIRSADLTRDSVPVSHLESSVLKSSAVDGILSFKTFYLTSYSNNEYCWSGKWGEICNPWAANNTLHMNKLKGRNSSTYSLILTDVEGNQYLLPIPLLKDAPF